MSQLLGNLFQSEAQTWVNTVNCVGIMEKGVALEFKKRFPDMFTDYEARCRAGEVRLGRPYLYKRLVEPWNSISLLNSTGVRSQTYGMSSPG